MTEENLKNLLLEIDSNIRSAKSSADLYAIDYVKNNKEEDRALSQKYLLKAEVWEEAKKIILAHARAK